MLGSRTSGSSGARHVWPRKQGDSQKKQRQRNRTAEKDRIGSSADQQRSMEVRLHEIPKNQPKNQTRGGITIEGQKIANETEDEGNDDVFESISESQGADETQHDDERRQESVWNESDPREMARE